jgi:hypothetical protein
MAYTVTMPILVQELTPLVLKAHTAENLVLNSDSVLKREEVLTVCQRLFLDPVPTPSEENSKPHIRVPVWFPEDLIALIFQALELPDLVLMLPVLLTNLVDLLTEWEVPLEMVPHQKAIELEAPVPEPTTLNILRETRMLKSELVPDLT